MQIAQNVLRISPVKQRQFRAIVWKAPGRKGPWSLLTSKGLTKTVRNRGYIDFIPHLSEMHGFT